MSDVTELGISMSPARKDVARFAAKTPKISAQNAMFVFIFHTGKTVFISIMLSGTRATRAPVCTFYSLNRCYVITLECVAVNYNNGRGLG